MKPRKPLQKKVVKKGKDFLASIYGRTPLVLYRWKDNKKELLELVRTDDGQLFELDGLIAELFFNLDEKTALGKLLDKLEFDIKDETGKKNQFEKEWSALIKFGLVDKIL